MSPAVRALRSDVVRRTASRSGTLRCAEASRVAYRDVDKSYASHRLSSHGWSQDDFKTALLSQLSSLSKRAEKDATAGSLHHYRSFIRSLPSALNQVRSRS